MDIRGVSSPTVGPIERAYRENGAKLWRAIVLFAGDRDIASEAVSEAFAQALRGETQIESADRWVWRTAFVLARGMLKDRQWTGSVPELPYTEPEAGFELRLALLRLSPSQRAAVVLFYFADLPTIEVARRMGTSTAAVSVHLHRARKRLRSLLEERDDG